MLTDTCCAFLYVDDDPRRRLRIEKQFHAWNINLASAGDQASALALANDVSFNAIAIVDTAAHVDFPHSLIQLTSIPNIPAVVYAVTNDDARAITQAFKAGVVDFIELRDEQSFAEQLRPSLLAAQEKISSQRQRDLHMAELKEENARLAELNAQQQTLLHEMNHRIGNSLQMITSMIRLQSQSTQDAVAKQVLQQAAERVIAVAQVHRQLYACSDTNLVGMISYLNQILSDYGITAIDQHNQLIVDIDDVSVKTEQAVSLGIIATELVASALHDLANTTGQSIFVRLRQLPDGCLEFSVEDHFSRPEAGNLPSTDIGTRIVNGMARSLGSHLEVIVQPLGQLLRVKFRSDLAFTATTAA